MSTNPHSVINDPDPSSRYAHGNDGPEPHALGPNTTLPSTTTNIDGAYTLGETSTNFDTSSHRASSTSAANTATIPTEYSHPNPMSGVGVGTAQMGVPHTVSSGHHGGEIHHTGSTTGLGATRVNENDLYPSAGEPVSERHIDHHPFGHSATAKMAPAADAHAVVPASDLSTRSDNAVSGNLLPYGVTHTTQGSTGAFEPKEHKLAQPHEHSTVVGKESVIDKVKHMFGGGHKLDSPSNPSASTEYGVDASGRVTGAK